MSDREDHRPVHRRRMVWRVYFFSLGLLIVVALAMLAIGAAFDSGRQRGRLPRWLVHHVATDLAPLLDHPDAMGRELASLGAELDMRLSIRTFEGQLLAANEVPPYPSLDPAQLDQLSSEGILRMEGKPTRLAAPIPSRSGEPRAYLVAEFPQIERTLLRPLAALGTVLLILALASLPFARSLVAPLERLTATAEELGAGRLSARSGLQRDDEVGTLAAAFDQMAQRLETLIHGEKELLANISHELRTPLARIRVALELAEEGDLEEARRYLAEIGADLEELDRLIEDVLVAARLDLGIGGSPPLRPVPVEAEELLERSASRFRRDHPERTVDLRLERPLPRLQADPILLRRVVDNLLDNARKYSDGPIELSAEVRGTELEIAVRDWGIGIDAADLERISRPFFRTERSRSRRSGGIGLGLSLARSILQAHGGRLAVESTPAKGSVFRIFIPLPEAAGDAGARERAES